MKIFIFVILVLAVVLEVALFETSRIGYDRGYDKGGGMDESNRNDIGKAD